MSHEILVNAARKIIQPGKDIRHRILPEGGDLGIETVIALDIDDLAEVPLFYAFMNASHARVEEMIMHGTEFDVIPICEVI
jgi:hypothetical protein